MIMSSCLLIKIMFLFLTVTFPARLFKGTVVVKVIQLLRTGEQLTLVITATTLLYDNVLQKRNMATLYITPGVDNL